VSSPATKSCSPCRYVAHPRRYGSAAGLTVSSCTANCSAGYACPAGSTSPIAQLCPAGTFSGVGAAVCSPCPGGSYGATQAMAALTCTGPCTAGYACPAGSVSPTALLCAPGQYSFAAVCSPCPAGQFGSSVGLTVDTCSGLCPSGRCVCVVWHVHIVRSRDAYHAAMWAFFLSCPQHNMRLLACVYHARLGDAPGQSSSQCVGPCDPGFWIQWRCCDLGM
jgi:hypothetical protein